VSTLPLPQLAVTHSWFWHMPPTAHAVPSAGAACSSHFWPEAPETMTAVHAFAPAQMSGDTQEFGERVHEKVQFPSHPVPIPLPGPKSHCSGGSTTPSPQSTKTQAPATQT
jgi:hypothetical protein